MDGTEREDVVCDNTALAVAKCRRGTLLQLGLLAWSAWFFTVAAWFTIEFRQQLWEEHLESSAQVQPWAPDAPRCEPVFVDPFEPLKPDGLLVPKCPPQIDLGEPEETPTTDRVYLL